MFLKVKLLDGPPQLFWYKAPASWQEPLLHSIVKVPLQRRTTLATVMQVSATQPDVSFVIRQALSQEQLPADPFYAEFIKTLSNYYHLSSEFALRRLQHFLRSEQQETEISSSEHQGSQIPLLTQEQQTICNFLYPHIKTPQYTPALIHGVTGSGKTEVYKTLMLYALADNKTILFLIPEVTLAVAFEQRLKKELPEYAHIIFGFHSATPVSQKRVLWDCLLQKKPIIIVGVHLPVLLPVPNLGLIIIDEEHDVGFQEKKHPKINTKEAALLRAHTYNIPIILGSATPSVSSWYNVNHKNWHLFKLTKRFAGALPKVHTIHLPSEKKRPHVWISNLLYKALVDRLARKEQSIIFINRRGFCFFMQCNSCQEIINCTNCSVSLTVHLPNILRCHYCGFECVQPASCPTCKQADFLKKGIGTQQMVSILQQLLPNARIARADLDSTVNRKKWQQTLSAFEKGDIDILVGTQTITKGYHFTNVTLVGIIWADLNLHMPLFNAGETTLQQLIQVAGRAGRQHPDSLVVVQTMVNHPIFNHINEIDYAHFCEQEIANRALLQYPPHARLAEIELKNADEQLLIKEAQQLANKLHALVQEKNLSVQILGPAEPIVQKIKNVFSRKIYLKGYNFNEIAMVWGDIRQINYKSLLFFTPNPLQ